MRGQFAVLGLALTALSGCTAVAAPAAGPATVAPKVSVSPIPMKVVTISVPKATGPAPALRNTGTSWLPVLTSLSAYGQWLLANPNPALVGTVADPGCGMANLLTVQIEGLLGSKAYVKTTAPTITSVLGTSPASTSTVALKVVASRAAEPVVSRAGGRTITTFAAFPQGSLWVTLNLGADRRWRFCTVESVDDWSSADDPSVPLI